MKIKFEKTFLTGKGNTAWYQHATMWAWKQHPAIQPFLLAVIKWLKQKWIDIKIENTMRDVDIQAKNIVDVWEKEDKPTTIITTTPSEVKGLDDMEIKRKD